MNNRMTDTDVLTGEVCNTLFFQGNGSSQTQLNKYTGGRKTEATTGEFMWCTGRNNLPALNVIYHPFIGKEIADVNLKPFDGPLSFINPIKVLGSVITWKQNKLNGFQFSQPNPPNDESVAFHSLNLSKWSVGQETDIKSHDKKYKSWLKDKDKTEGLILWGVSRGTAATFCALAENQYENIRLVVLEGAIDSVAEVIPKRADNLFKNKTASKYALNAVNYGLNFFYKQNITKYHADGPSPLSNVKDFPKNVPVVFITSKMDQIVPPENTRNIAQALANNETNDVYLLELDKSSHPNYMFDDKNDHDRYEQFIHAIYERYQLQHDPELALKGKELLSLCKLKAENYSHDEEKKLKLS
jgi:hypothetical protein